MRFIVDANLSPRLADLLESAGHDAVAVRELGLADASEEEILDRASNEERVLISHFRATHVSGMFDMQGDGRWGSRTRRSSLL